MPDSGSRSLSRFTCFQTDAVLGQNDDDVYEYESSVEFEDEEYLQVLLHKEREHNRIQSLGDDWIKIARSEAIQWIINTRALFRFQFHTAYLSIVYIDRCLLKGLIDSDKHRDWAIQLLSVACLSLAAKNEEHNIPALSEFPIEEYNFHGKVIQRMELLVLTTLQWRIRFITPFHFIQFFVSCLCRESPKRHFVSLTTQIAFATTKDMNLMSHRSSTIAIAATLMAMETKLTKQSMETKLKTTSRLNLIFDLEDVYTCYTRMLELELVLAKSFENPSGSSAVGTKRKRPTFSKSEKPPTSEPGLFG